MEHPNQSTILLKLRFAWEEHNNWIPEEKHEYEYAVARGSDDFVEAVREKLWPVMEDIYNADRESLPWDSRLDTLPDPIPLEPVYVTEGVADALDPDVVVKFGAQSINFAYLHHPEVIAREVGQHPVSEDDLVEAAEQLIDDYDPNPSELVDSDEYKSLDEFN